MMKKKNVNRKNVEQEISFHHIHIFPFISLNRRYLCWLNIFYFFLNRSSSSSPSQWSHTYTQILYDVSFRVFVFI